ncbi:MAG TPA: tetratricopeptide repeat protein [Gallionellaceae bacterium]|nr:tetratricopeptide repeat protein [Gallionellaceae bacterium]
MVNANAQQETQAGSEVIAAADTSVKAPAPTQALTKQKLLGNADALIKAGKPADAYALLLPYQSLLAGDVNYDYLLGIAALDSGKPNEAIFALERVLAVNPNHLQARAEIARAYLATGELAASKKEFETVQQQNPPKEVSATIQKYLDIIETDRTGKTTSFRAYIEAALGNDSNVNSATSTRDIAIPYFGGAVMTMNDAGVENRDSFGSLAAGFNVRHVLNRDWALIGGANVNQRNNSTQTKFNTTNIDGNFGASLTRGDDNYSAVLQAQSFSLDSKSYRDAAGVTGQWQRNRDNGSQGSVYVQYTSLSYPGQTFRNADRYVLGGAYAMALSGESTPVVYGGAYAGAESPQKSSVAYIGNTLYGVRLGGEMKYSPQTTLLASASLESRTYGGDDPLFLMARKDTQADLRLAVGYVPVQKWTVTPSLSYTSNDSNIIINKYQRTMFSVSLRRDFD